MTIFQMKLVAMPTRMWVYLYTKQLYYHTKFHEAWAKIDENIVRRWCFTEIWSKYLKVCMLLISILVLFATIVVNTELVAYTTLVNNIYVTTALQQQKEIHIYNCCWIPYGPTITDMCHHFNYRYAKLIHWLTLTY